jgi:hypothetical protein
MTNQNPTFTLELTLEETNVVLAALQELPAKLCNPLTEKIRTQAQTQIAAMQPVEEKANEEILAAE